MLIRPESSVSIEKNEFGEVVFACDRDGPVIHRTPEELGLAAVVPDVPMRKAVSYSWTDVPGAGPMRAAGVKRDKPRPASRQGLGISSQRLVKGEPLRTIGGVKVRMAPGAQMGAEMLEHFSAGDGEEQGKDEAMPTGKFGTVKTPEEVRIKILEEGYGLSAKALAAKYNVSEATVFVVRKEGGITRQRGPGERPGESVAPVKARAMDLGVQPVEIDAQRAGSGAALINALSNADKAAAESVRIRVEIELSQGEINQVLERLGPEQRIAFLSAGLRAALLA
jgi:hypothetical protein